MSYSYRFRFSFAGTSFFESLIRFVVLLVTYSSFQFSTRMSMFRFDNSVRIGEQSCLRCLGFAVHILTHLFPEVAIKSRCQKQACRFLEIKNSTCNYHVTTMYVTYTRINFATIIFKDCAQLSRRYFSRTTVIGCLGISVKTRQLQSATGDLLTRGVMNIVKIYTHATVQLQ